MSRRRYFEEQRSGNGAICHCVEMEIDLSSGNYVNLFDLMSKIESSTISQGDINSVLSYLREGEAFNIHTQSPVSLAFSTSNPGEESVVVRIRFDPAPAIGEEHGIIYRFWLNNQKYVFMFSNRYNGMRDLINNADEDINCITYAREDGIYYNDSFFVFI